MNYAGMKSHAAGLRFCSRHESGNCGSRAGKKITGPQCRCLINVIYSSNYSEGRWSVSSPGLAFSDSWSWWRSPYCLNVLHPQPGCYEAANPMTRGDLEKSGVIWYFCCYLSVKSFKLQINETVNESKAALGKSDTFKWSPKKPSPFILRLENL